MSIGVPIQGSVEPAVEYINTERQPPRSSVAENAVEQIRTNYRYNETSGVEADTAAEKKPTTRAEKTKAIAKDAQRAAPARFLEFRGLVAGVHPIGARQYGQARGGGSFPV